MSDPIRILIVEDDAVTAAMFRDMLEHAGYVISGLATNGAQAVAMTTALRPDVVLMDIKMPGMDGITCADTILAQCPTPVIIISGYDDPRLVERAKRAGVGAYLVKPVKLADLQRSIVLVLARFQDLKIMQHERLVTLGTLAAGVAHEINNPVHVILLNASVLQAILDDLIPVLDNLVQERADFMIGKLPYTTFKPNLLKIAKGITGAGQRISEIVAALKDFVRPDDAVNVFEPVDVNEVVRKALDLLASPIRKSTHRFSVVYGANLPKLPKGRPRKIEQVVINLLMNACQALSGPDKAVRIVTGHDPDTNSLMITVEDEGCGIPPGLIARIKDPFLTTKRSKGGTGLGLSISDGIVREHHGCLEFASREGHGTTARMVLPLYPAGAPEEL
ncbi:MAG: response regulator [Verrucomicrobiota bacterium]